MELHFKKKWLFTAYIFIFQIFLTTCSFKASNQVHQCRKNYQVSVSTVSRSVSEFIFKYIYQHFHATQCSRYSRYLSASEDAKPQKPEHKHLWP